MPRISGQRLIIQGAKRIPLYPHIAFRPLAPVIRKIAFPMQNGICFIDPTQVTYLSAQSNYTRIQLTSGRAILVSKTLKYCMGIFPGDFLRIHQSHLVNPAFLSFYNTLTQIVELDDGTSLPVSRSGKKLFR